MKRDIGIFEKCFDVEMFNDGTGIGIEVLDTVILSKAVDSDKSKVFKVQTRCLKNILKAYLSSKKDIEDVIGNVKVSMRQTMSGDVFIKLTYKEESYAITVEENVLCRLLD